MSLNPIPAAQLLTRLADFDTIIDARTPDEHALDHIPGAVNWPTLDNAQRITIGTKYKQEGAFEAKKLGAAWSARNIAAHIERHVVNRPKDWQPLVYCWRGGQRSGALATILSAIGFQVTVVQGGYKAWRAALVSDLEALPAKLRFRVLTGPTGSGKTRLLNALMQSGAQVLDLEALACHRSSVLGLIPGQAQPTQKQFESRLWVALRGMNPQRLVYVESESKKVGNLRVPDALMQAMRASPCVDLVMPMQARVAMLLEDYAHFVQSPDAFCKRLEALVTHRGHETIRNWIEMVQQGQTTEVVQALLTLHYDPTYRASTPRNYTQWERALRCELSDGLTETLQTVAQRLVASENPLG